MEKNIDKRVKKEGSVYFFRLFAVGGAMGVANIIPGVSGGTIAVVFGIYEKLMEALAGFISDKEKRWQYIRFLTLVFSGALVSILLFARFLAWAFDNYELITVYFFLGLIIGSIPVVIRTHSDMQIKPERILAFLAGLIIVITLAQFQGSDGVIEGATAQELLQLKWNNYFYFVFSGAIAASAMIIPGLSGSFILILLGIYRTVLDSLSQISKIRTLDAITPEIKVQIGIIVSLAIGVVGGILGFSRLMNWALKHYPALIMYFIIGLIIGSLYQIYPGFELSLQGGAAVLSLLIGFAIAIRFGRE